MNVHPEILRLEEKVQKLEQANVELRKHNSQLKTAYYEMQQAFLFTMHNIIHNGELLQGKKDFAFSRVARYSELIAKNMGLSQDEIQLIRDASATYDLGKMGIPVDILFKNEPLTNEEFDIVKTHTTIGGNLLSSVDDKAFHLARQIALSHHERWDGSGYPIGLSEEKIPLPARIVALADVFDALVSNRPYREAFPVHIACEMIRTQRSKHFDPRIVDIFEGCIKDLVHIRSDKPF